MDEGSPIPGKAAVEPAKGWNYRQLVFALVVAFVLQSLLLPCLCQVGTAKITVATVLDALILLRVLLARLMNQQDRGWIFYAVLLYLSTPLIEVGSRMMRSGH